MHASIAVWFPYSSHSALSKSIFHKCEANTWWTKVSVHTQRTLSSLYWKNAKTWATRVKFVNMKKHVYIAHTIPFVFAHKSDKFQFEANGMWTACRWCNVCSQSHLHLHVFGIRTIGKLFGSQLYTSPNSWLFYSHIRLSFGGLRSQDENVITVFPVITFTFNMHCLI